MNKKKVLTIPVFICYILVAFLPILSVAAAKALIDLEMNRNVYGKLKQAADANSIELAKTKLSEVVGYMEEKKLISGSTHIFFSTPNNDISFFYNNLSSALHDLDNFPQPSGDLSQYNLAVSNQLMKLRETILDNDEQVTSPHDLSLFPNQMVWWFLKTLSVIWIIVVLLFFVVKYDNRNF